MKNLIVVFLLISCGLLAQTQQAPQQYNASQISFFLDDPPQKVVAASVQLLDNPGPATYCYWVAINHLIGRGPLGGPFCTFTGPNAMTNGIRLSWAPVIGAVSYDVLRTANITPPSGACNCAVTTATSSTSATDTGSLSAYTVSAFDPSTVVMSETNESVSSGISAKTWRVGSGGTRIARLSSSGAWDFFGALNMNGFGITTGGFKGPNPWYDVTQNGLVCDWNGSTGTDDTVAFQALMTSICTSPGAGRVLIPVGKACRMTAQISIPCEVTIEGDVANGGAFGAGSFLVADYNEATATRPFLNWNGNNFLTQGVGGGIHHLVVWKATGKTGGAAIGLTATDCNHRPGHIQKEDLRCTGDGTWNYCYVVDGTACTSAGTQGIRDIADVNFQTFQTTSGAMLLKNAVHQFWGFATTSPTGGGNADIVVDGGGTATSNSTDVALYGSISGNETLNNATNVISVINVSGTLTSTANTGPSIFFGLAGAYAPINNLAIFGFDNTAAPSQNGGFTWALRAQTYLGAGTTIPSNVLNGDVFANQDFVLVKSTDVSLGQNAIRIRRNNGSGSNTNMAFLGTDGNVHWNFDFSTGFSTDTRIISSVATGTAPLSIASTTPVSNLTVQNCDTCKITTSIAPSAAGGVDVGTAALPFSGIRIGGAATNNARLTGTFTAARTITFPDNTFTTAQSIAAGTVTTAGTAVSAGTCQAQTGITVTGATTTDVGIVSLNAALPATWQTGIQWNTPQITANTCTISLCNPTAASITPSATTLRCAVLR